MSTGLKRKRVAAGAGISLGATLGLTTTAQAADFTVTGAGDANTGGSLRQAINDANANNNGPTVDRILFSSSLTGTINLGSTLPAIDEPVEIVGPGAGRLTVDGNDSFRLIRADADLTLSGLTLTDGFTAGYGGAIYGSGGDVVIERAILSGNASDSEGGAVEVNGPDLTIRSSTITDNDSQYGGGVAISAGNLTIQDSTISGNEGGDRGGGVYSKSSTASVTIVRSTITGNSAPASGGGIYSNNTDLDPSITGTIVANNTAGAGPDLRGVGGDTFELGFSLIENASGVGINETGPNLLGVDPQLGALGSNGGPTPTHALSATSPALDRGNATGTDQRGLPRVFDFPALPNASGGNGADIGAFELQGDRCAGKVESRPAALAGTAAADVIVGTGAADVIRSKGGRDLVCAGNGKDKVRGGPGNDTLRGEGGRDTLRGQGGRDRLIGGPGRDLLIGGLLRDILRGGPGRDTQRQ